MQHAERHLDFERSVYYDFPPSSKLNSPPQVRTPRHPQSASPKDSSSSTLRTPISKMQKILGCYSSCTRKIKKCEVVSLRKRSLSSSSDCKENSLNQSARLKQVRPFKVTPEPPQFKTASKYQKSSSRKKQVLRKPVPKARLVPKKGTETSPVFNNTMVAFKSAKPKSNSKLNTSVRLQSRNCQKQNSSEEREQSGMWKSAVLTQSAALAQQLKRPRLSDFLKIKLVGCGKFGRVHMAVDKRTGWLYALKSIRKSMLVKYGLVGQLIREVTIHLFVNHPNIIRLYSYFDDEHHVYLLSELGERGQLYKLLKARQRFPEREAVGLIVQVLSALKYLHDRRIVHRDLKPENLVVTGNQVKLTDFGWAAAMTDGNPRSTFCGTPEYVSPEIVKGEDYDESTDCWALGVLSYELLFGVSPFGIRNEKDIDKVLWKEVRFGAEGEVSGEAKDFISRLLERNQRLRMKLGEAREHPWLKVRAQ